MKKLMSSVACFILPCSVFAAESAAVAVESGTDWKAFGANVLVIVLGIAGAVIVKSAHVAIKAIAAKFNAESVVADDKMVQAGLEYAYHYVEEWAKKQAQKPTNNEKLDMGLKVVREVVALPSVQGMSNEALAKLLESTVNKKREE